MSTQTNKQTNKQKKRQIQASKLPCLLLPAVSVPSSCTISSLLYDIMLVPHLTRLVWLILLQLIINCNSSPHMKNLSQQWSHNWASDRAVFVTVSDSHYFYFVQNLMDSIITFNYTAEDMVDAVRMPVIIVVNHWVMNVCCMKIPFATTILVVW